MYLWRLWTKAGYSMSAGRRTVIAGLPGADDRLWWFLQFHIGKARGFVEMTHSRQGLLCRDQLVRRQTGQQMGGLGRGRPGKGRQCQGG